MILTLAIIVIGTIAVVAFFLAPKFIPGNVIYDVTPDSPCPFGFEMAWIAIKSPDTQAVLDALGLLQVERTNWRSGVGTIYHSKLGENRIFVSPPLDDKWTLIAGLALPQPLNGRFIDKWSPLMEDLATQFPEVQYYFSYPLIDFYAWARMLKGRISRAFAIGDEGIILKKGRITREEKSLALKLFELRGVRDLKDDAGGELVLYPTENHVMKLAAQWSLDPTKLSCKSGEPGLGFIGQAPAQWRPERLREAA